MANWSAPEQVYVTATGTKPKSPPPRVMISIVTPSYDQLSWLRLALASVADQKGVEVEHIVQDGGTDGIEEVFRSATQFPRAKLFVENDHGMYDAINRGLRRASGEICAYLNCDEQYLPGTLARVDAFFRARPEVEVLFGDVVIVDRAGHPLSYRRAVLPSVRHVRFSHLNTNSCAMFFRRRLVESGHLFETQWKTIGDAVWVERLLRAGVKMATVPQPLATFAFTGDNLGASALSEEEVLRWRRASLAPKKWQRAMVVLAHRIRKGLAGAYCRRRVEIEVFTEESPTKREQFVGTKVGFGWPAA